MAKTRAMTRSYKSGLRKPQFSVLAQQNVFDSDDILLHVLYYCSLKEVGNFIIAFPRKKAVLSNIEIDYEVTIDSEELIVFLVSNKIRLTSFYLDYDHKLTDYHLLALANISPNLHTINGGSHYLFQWSVSTAGIRGVTERCPRIENWWFPLNEPEVSLQVVSNAYPDLRGVRIGPFDEGNNKYREVDRSVVVSFINRCQQLEHLEILGSDIEDADVELICTLRRLQYLELYNCSTLTPNCLQFLLECNHLEILRIILSVVHSDSTEDDDSTENDEMDDFNEMIFELLTKSKSLHYVEVDVYREEVEDIVVPPTWRRVVSKNVHEFFKL